MIRLLTASQNQYWLSRLETEGVIEDNASRSDRPSSSTQSVEPSDKNVYGTKFCQTISSRNFVNAKADLPPYESETIFTKPNSQERPSARPDRSPKLSAQFISPGSVHRIHSRDKTEHEGWSDLQQIPQKHTMEIPPSIVARPFAERHVLPPPPPPPPLPNLTRPITKPPAFLPPPPPRPSGFSSYLPYPPAPGAPLPSNPTYIPTPGVPVAGFSPGISPSQPSPGLHDVRSRGAVTLPQEEQRLGSTNTHSLRRTPSSGSDSAITASEGPRRSNLASQWPLERVTSWLISNSFSDGWVTTFKNLKIEGSEVVDLGVGRNGRGNVAMMHQRIYPELARVCTRNGILWDQAREREEGKRLRRLLARDMKVSGHGSLKVSLSKYRELVMLTQFSFLIRNATEKRAYQTKLLCFRFRHRNRKGRQRWTSQIRSAQVVLAILEIHWPPSKIGNRYLIPRKHTWRC